MKTELTSLSETRKRLDIEIPAAKVDQAIDRLAKQLTKRAKVPGFRPGKVPISVVRQRFMSDILHDVSHDLVPPAVDTALRDHEMVPVETPDVHEISIDAGQPLTFHALFEVMPALEDLDYEALTLRRTPVKLDAAAAERALEELRRRASKLEQVTDRAVKSDDMVTLDLTRKGVAGPDGPPETPPEERHEGVSIELGSPANPPGFDDELVGLEPGDTKSFELTYPANHEPEDLADTTVAYNVEVKAIHRRELPELDDAFATSIGEFESLEALKERIASDLEREAKVESDREVRRDLLSQLASRVTVEMPEALVNREIGRRLEQIASRLAQQQVDPTKANIDWETLKEEQRTPALETVRGSMVLDEVVKRESLSLKADEVDEEVTRYAERLGQTPAAVRAQLEKEDGFARLAEGMLREQAVEFLLSRATIVTA